MGQDVEPSAVVQGLLEADAGFREALARGVAEELGGGR